MNFRFSSYWGNWSRVLKLPSDSDPTYIEVDLTPIYGHNWERVREVRIRRHLTAPDPKDTLSQTLPSEVREKMVEALGGRLTDFILTEDLLTGINWKKYENVPMERLKSFPPNSNPYHYDAFHMGLYVGKNLMMMHSNHPGEECEYLIFINTRTGERFRMDLEEFMQYEKEV